MHKLLSTFPLISPTRLRFARLRKSLITTTQKRKPAPWAGAMTCVTVVIDKAYKAAAMKAVQRFISKVLHKFRSQSETWDIFSEYVQRTKRHGLTKRIHVLPPIPLGCCGILG